MSELATLAALEEWSRLVAEPAGHAPNGARRIDGYIRGAMAMGWRWLRRYRRNGQSAWCGAFQAHAEGVAGLRPVNRRAYLPSCARLYRWSSRRARRKPWHPGPSDGRARRIDPADIERGDLVIVGPEPAPRSASRKLRKARPRHGKHITRALGPPTDGYIETVEGNAHGQFPDGSHGEGVVRRERPMRATNPRTYRILYGVRPLDDDYDVG